MGGYFLAALFYIPKSCAACTRSAFAFNLSTSFIASFGSARVFYSLTQCIDCRPNIADIDRQPFDIQAYVGTTHDFPMIIDIQYVRD